MDRGINIVGSKRTSGERGYADFYPTPHYATRALLDREIFTSPILEPACGDGAMATVIEEYGYNVDAMDLNDWGYGITGVDFLSANYNSYNSIITNPPYSLALPFVMKAKQVATDKIAMFFKTVFLEGERRYKMFQDTLFPLKCIYQFCGRVNLYPFNHTGEKISGTVAYAWFVWDRSYIGKPYIEWVPK